jgi:endonuclease/exonuclease/phosphatase family metal-dependent hydrolase
VRLVSFNIRYGYAEDGPYEWRFRRADLRALLLELEPDVLCLQEAMRFQVGEIAEWLAGYSWVGVGRDDGEENGEYAAIFFKDGKTPRCGTFWLSPTPETPGSMGWGARLPRICTWAEVGDLTIANVHLDHESAMARAEGMRLILERVQGNAVICGDFNAETSEPFFPLLAQAGFQDLAFGTGDTFNAFSHDPHGRIDYVMGRGVSATAAKVVRDPIASDHWPVVVDLSLSS